MSSSKRFKRSVPIQSINDDLKNSIEDFKFKLNEFNKNLDLIKQRLDNPIDIIYDECNELKRIIQLDKEESILNIKESNNIDLDLDDCKIDAKIMSKIDRINSEFDMIYQEIDNHEKEAISKMKLVRENKNLKREFNKLKKISDYFIKYWIDYLNESAQIIDTSKLVNAVAKTRQYIEKFADFYYKLKPISFGNKMLELKKHKEPKADRLNHYVYYKQEIELDTVKCHSNELEALDTTLNDDYYMSNEDYKSVDCHIDLFEDGNYLMVLIGADELVTDLFILDRSSKKILKKNKLKDYLVQICKISQNLILMIGSSETYENSILVLDSNLELAFAPRLCTDYVFLSNSKRPHFCEINENEAKLKVFDSSLNEILNTKFQTKNKLEPFYLCETVYEFGYSNDKYYFLDNSGHSLRILNHSGYLLKEIEFTFDSIPSLAFDSAGNMVIFDDSSGKLLIYNQNGMQLKEIQIKKTKIRSDIVFLNLLIDYKSRYILYNFDRKKFFVINH